MIKYTETLVGFSEIPDEISLCINISNCPFKCKGCHSPHLQEDIGEPLTTEILDELIKKNEGITCVCFMGGELAELFAFTEHVHKTHKLKVGWYTGYPVLWQNTLLEYLDYIKLGPYIEEQGALDNPNTNQRFYKVEEGTLHDITYKFWKSNEIKN